MSQLRERCERFVEHPHRRGLRACSRAAAGATDEELSAGLGLLVDGAGLSPARAGRVLGLPAQEVLRLLRQERSEHEHALSGCPGWPLVRGGIGLTEAERAAGAAHEDWCADCRARATRRDRTRRRLLAAGSASTVTATASAGLVGTTSAIATKTVLAIAVGTAAVGSGTALVVHSRQSPAGHQRPAHLSPVGVTSPEASTAPTTIVVPGTPAPPRVSPSAAADGLPSLRPSSAPSALPSPPTQLLPSALPSLPLPTLPLPTLPLPLPTLPLPVPTLPAR